MTIAEMTTATRGSKSAVSARSDEAATIAELVRAARADGDELTGPEGLLKRITKMVLEAALEEEMTEHLGRAKGQAQPTVQEPPQGFESAVDGADLDGVAGQRNVRNGIRRKTVLTDAVGKVTIGVPRDRAGTFEPVIVPKHKRKLGSVDQIVLSLTAKGLTTGEISAHLEEIYGASVSKDTICRITDRIIEEMNEWLSRPLDPGSGLRGNLHRRRGNQGA